MTLATVGTKRQTFGVTRCSLVLGQCLLGCSKLAYSELVDASLHRFTIKETGLVIGTVKPVDEVWQQFEARVSLPPGVVQVVLLDLVLNWAWHSGQS